MENKINVLPESVANQIAAGEVVQRPSSAVKELLENALDSGATNITLNIRDAGKSLIQVIDNGSGMSEIDARLSVERHATSKISKIDDIFHILTMGFRGEALASISAVSQFELKTRDNQSELATCLKMNGSEIVSQEPESGNTGTSISVKNLFFNVPARRNFLKSNSVENRHILEVFQQISLSRPDVSFQYFNNDAEIYRLEGTTFRQRIIQLFGKRYNDRLIPVEENTEIVKVSGFIGKPEFATSKKSEQFFLVNKRFVKSPYLHHSIMAGFEEVLPKDSSPQYFFHLEIDPSQIDVNIHPTKTEIKFLEERSIYAILRTTVKQSLGKFNIAPSLDFERETAFDNIYIDRNRKIKIPGITVDKNFDPFRTNSVLFQNKTTADKSDYENETRELYQVDVPDKIKVPLEEKKIQSKLNNPGDDHIGEKSRIIQLHNKFILTQLQSGFMVIDQHRAHQRILYEKFLLGRQRNGFSQKLLFPVLFELDRNDFELVQEIRPDLEKIGFSIEEFGKDSLSINGAPPGCREDEIRKILQSVLDDYKAVGEKQSKDRYDKLSYILASNMAIKSGQKLQEKEMENLIDQLFACEMPYSLPNGKPIVITLTLEELGKKFQY